MGPASLSQTGGASAFLLQGPGQPRRRRPGDLPKGGQLLPPPSPRAAGRSARRWHPPRCHGDRLWCLKARDGAPAPQGVSQGRGPPGQGWVARGHLRGVPTPGQAPAPLLRVTQAPTPLSSALPPGRRLPQVPRGFCGVSLFCFLKSPLPPQGEEAPRGSFFQKLSAGWSWEAASHLAASLHEGGQEAVLEERPWGRPP